MNILLTGGCGYIGSHTAVALSSLGFNPVLFDNLSNSKINVLEGLDKILSQKLAFIEGDVRDVQLVVKVLKDYQIDAVIHFAAMKAVGESVEYPLNYYSNNVGGTVSLLQAMEFAGVKKIVFSSSATVYGIPKYLPIDECHPIKALNPYGKSKAFIEEILSDHSTSRKDWSIASLRYFNPVGAHESGFIGENPNGTPNNLMPFLVQVALGKIKKLLVCGNDYPTKDGTGIRDYIHVMDLASGHLAALNFLSSNLGYHAFNLGTGHPSSVLDIINCFEAICGVNIPFEYTHRRAGDLAICFANPEKAERLLKWRAKYSLEDMMNSAWDFARKNFA